MNIELIWKRPDGTFVMKGPRGPYHVIPGDEPLWSLAVAKAAEMGRKLKLEPQPEPEPEREKFILSKLTLWRRLTDEEADTLEAALAAAPTRDRRMFEAAQYLDTRDEDYPTLRAGVVAALGEERADEVLQPET